MDRHWYRRNVGIDLREDVRPEAVPRLTIKSRVGLHGPVRLGVRNENEERLARLDLALHEVERLVRQFAIN